MLVFILFSTEEELVSFLCCCFAKVLPSHFTESKDVPSVPVHWGFPEALSVLVFHVPLVMLSLPRILGGAPAECLTSPSWCAPEGAILVNPGGDRSGMVWFLVVISW